MASRSAWTAKAAAWTTSLSSGCGAASNTRRSTSMLMRVWPKPDRYWRLAGLLQHGAPAPEPGLSHAAANLPRRPVDMWTIGGADRLRFPGFPSELGKRGNARLRPHTHRHHSQQND